MTELFYKIIIVMNIIIVALTMINFYAGNEIKAIFQATQSMYIFLIVLFIETTTRRR